MSCSTLFGYLTTEVSTRASYPWQWQYRIAAKGLLGIEDVLTLHFLPFSPQGGSRRGLADSGLDFPARDLRGHCPKLGN